MSKSLTARIHTLTSRVAEELIIQAAELIEFDEVITDVDVAANLLARHELDEDDVRVMAQAAGALEYADTTVPAGPSRVEALIGTLDAMIEARGSYRDHVRGQVLVNIRNLPTTLKF